MSDQDAQAEESRWQGLKPGALLILMLSLCLIAYGAVLIQFDPSRRASEIVFGAPADQALVRLYLQAVDIDPLNDSIQIRISVLPNAAGAKIADRNYTLHIWHDDQIDDLVIEKDRPLPETTLQVNLQDGDAHNYPLDTYAFSVALKAVENASAGQANELPIRLTAWDSLTDFKLNRVPATGESSELMIGLAVQREGAASFFAIALYGAMLVMASCALTIGTLVFLRKRRIEVSMIGALGAIIFALPALRHALPGSPPMGVWLDVLIFFWAELAAIMALCLFVAAWALRGARPHDH
ncbi:MAG: DUF4436 family protein [Parvibaculaceae bacterium]